MTTITLIDYTRPLAERAKSRKVCGPYHFTLPPVSRKACNGVGLSFYMASRGFEMDRHGSAIALRIEPANDHLEHLRLNRINGYYCDEFGDQTIQPIIARLPHARGFLAGWTMGAGMCGGLDPAIYDDPRNAAYAAHTLAESVAENERENLSDESDD